MTARLPAPITITAGRGTYRIGRDGRMRRVPPPPSPYPRAATWFPATDTWYMLERHRLVVGRGHTTLWHSRLLVPSRWRLGVIAAGPSGVAFQFEHKLYIAPLGRAERPVARREFPLGWTAAGLYTYAYQGKRLLLRSDTGRLLKAIARRPVGSSQYVSNGRLYFISRGAVMRARGTRTEPLAWLQRLGLSAEVSMQRLGRFISLEDDHRLVALRDDGSVFAWTPLPPGSDRDAGLVGFPAVAPRAGLLAFATLSGQARRAVRTETVYLLRSGAHEASPVYSEHGSFGGCAVWVDLQWHGRWLLYSSNQGYLSVIDSTGGDRTTELTGFVRRQPGIGNSFISSWTGEPPI